MKIVITGGLGFIGSNLAQYLQQRVPSARLICIDWAVPRTEHPQLPYTEIVLQNFADPDLRRCYADADVIVHLAATTTVQDSVKDPIASFTNNVTATHSLLETLRKTAPHAHMIFASTGGAIIGEHDGPINERISPRPVSPYGASKLAVEGLLSAYAGSYGLRAASLRFSNVYGPNSAHKGSVIAAFCKAYLETGQLTVNGDGRQTRDYVHVADICQAIHKTILEQARGVFQLGTGHATSILDLVAAFQSRVPSRSIHVRHAPALQGEVTHNVCDISLARVTLGFTPRFDLQTGLEDTLRWFESRRGARTHRSSAA